MVRNKHNTPGIIKYPFWQMTKQWKNSSYICINMGEAWAPPEIDVNAVCLNEDVSKALEYLSFEQLKDSMWKGRVL